MGLACSWWREPPQLGGLPACPDEDEQVRHADHAGILAQVAPPSDEGCADADRAGSPAPPISHVFSVVSTPCSIGPLVCDGHFF